jgi:molybdopterin converting factor small subunit
MKAISTMPGSASLPPNPLVAVNHSYAKNSRILVDGDEVALIPPVAGG